MELYYKYFIYLNKNYKWHNKRVLATLMVKKMSEWNQGICSHLESHHSEGRKEDSQNMEACLDYIQKHSQISYMSFYIL